jgi:hypothetical protein
MLVSSSFKAPVDSFNSTYQRVDAIPQGKYIHFIIKRNSSYFLRGPELQTGIHRGARSK